MRYARYRKESKTSMMKVTRTKKEIVPYEQRAMIKWTRRQYPGTGAIFIERDK